MIIEEEADTGDVTIGDLNNYLSFSFGCWSYWMYFIFGLVSALLQLYTTYFVSDWSNKPFEEQQRSYYPIVFGISVLVYMLFTFLRGLVIFSISLTSSKNMHNKMVEKICRAPILFFDSNPVGRVQTRFSKDTATLDLLIPPITVFASFGLFRTLTVFIIVCVIQPWLVLVILIAVCLMFCVFKYSVTVMIQSQREDSIFRGPLNSGMTNILIGLVSIRTYERIEHFRMRFYDDLEKSCNVTFTYFAVNRVMGFWLDLICLIFSLCVSTMSLLIKVDKEKNAELAFSLQIITDVIVFFSISLRFVAELENYFTSSQRIVHYTE